MTALDFFEELRFIIELLAAEHLFAYVFAKRREHYGRKLIVSGLILIAASCAYPFLSEIFSSTGSVVLVNVLNIGWYVLLTISTGFHIWFCYRLTSADTAFLTVAGYCLQHIEYLAVNEVLALGVWRKLPEHLFLYVSICIVTTTILYYVVYGLSWELLSRQGGKLFDDKPNNLGLTMLMAVIVFICTFMCQSMFLSGRQDRAQINYLGAATDFFICILILWVQYVLCTIRYLNREKDIVEHLLYERKRQYDLSRENIETINHKCHDLKHQIQALKQVDSKERDQYIDELENSIGIYDAVVETKNEVVNTILSEKTLNCENRHIRLSYIVDADYLDFMSTLDIYAILGNALDNAIENVSKYKDEDKRVISLTIKSVGEFLSIQTNNYCEQEVEIRDGLPVTTKKNKEYHGFGMKSMRHLAEKYGGSLATKVENHVFTLQILIPMPKEFLRLYALEQGTSPK